MVPNDKGKEQISARELDQLYDRFKVIERAGEAQDHTLVDLQVRVAQMEAKEPIGREEFEPVRRLVWGFVGTVLIAVLIAVLALVVHKTGGGSLISVKPL